MMTPLPVGALMAHREASGSLSTALLLRDPMPRSVYSAYKFRDTGIYAAIAADCYPEKLWWRHQKK